MVYNEVLHYGEHSTAYNVNRIGELLSTAAVGTSGTGGDPVDLNIDTRNLLSSNITNHSGDPFNTLQENVNEKLDSGITITRKSFFIDSKDNELLLKKKTQILEYQAFPEAIIKIFRNN